MLAITQFEVYAFTDGRWTLHARYPGEDRNEAILDARTTEAATGFPTKVLRETYYPEDNNSETITAYISPKAKEAQRKISAKDSRVGRTSTQPTAATNERTGKRRSGRPRLTFAQAFFRVLVAGAISLGAATMITGVIAWAMSWVASAGNIAISPDARTTSLSFAYAFMFLYIFWSLFRSRLPLHRYLSDLWQKAATQAQPTAKVPTVDGKPPQVVPKHDRGPSPEKLREWEDMKVKRGDLDANKPPELPEPLPPAVAVAPPAEAVAPPVPPEKTKPEKTAAQQTTVESAVPVAPPPALETEKPAEKKKDKNKEKEKQKAEEAEMEAATEEAAFTPEDLNLERMVLRRFAVDTVKPAIKSAMPDDPVARRGAAIVLAGGAAGVAATARLGANAEMELLTDALRHIGMNPATIETFMAQHNHFTTAPANHGLLAAGRQALAGYLEGAPNLADILARALSSWRTPFGQVAGQPASAPPEILPLIDVYLMTELREEPRAESNETAVDAFHDQAMGVHNNVVRHALTAHGGHEVKHTGKGIFARFTTATAAVDAAMDMQRQYSDEGSTLAIGIVGNTVVGEDPILSADIVRQAQAILTRAGAGEILCETQVRAAALRQRPPTDDNQIQDAEDLDLVRLVVPEATFEASETTDITPTASKPEQPTLH